MIDHTRARIWRNFDFILLGVTLLLIIYGILMIRSATLGAVDTNVISRVPSQITYAIAGVVILLIVAAIDYRLLGAIHQYLYIFLVGILGLVAVLGVVGAAGAQRWLTVGIPVQPSEIAKVLLIIILAQHLSKQYTKLDKLQTVIISLGYIGVPVMFIFLQPSLGISILIMFTWFIMIWAAGLRGRHIMLFLAVIILGLPILWSNMQPYQRGRIFSFLSCESNKDQCYNIQQARISIGSGGLLGKGYAFGTQSQLRFLRVRWTDFIFSVIAEELGFVGAVLVLVLIGLLLWRILRAARLAQDPLGALICYGVAASIFFQTFVSIGMNLGLLPVTGLTLPFISSGGSSLLTLLVGIGLVESVIMRHKGLDY
ncbi:MAG TPA: FtsW/RodA/SpoVE family cell cycle protein [Aggregatilineales bacterium]|nr:FtsW/RodA/SpoVE family cell cycle protein [Aggregatilineales bacterium]